MKPEMFHYKHSGNHSAEYLPEKTALSRFEKIFSEKKSRSPPAPLKAKRGWPPVKKKHPNAPFFPGHGRGGGSRPACPCRQTKPRPASELPVSGGEVGAERARAGAARLRLTTRTRITAVIDSDTENCCKKSALASNFCGLRRLLRALLVLMAGNEQRSICKHKGCTRPALTGNYTKCDASARIQEEKENAPRHAAGRFGRRRRRQRRGQPGTGGPIC